MCFIMLKNVVKQPRNNLETRKIYTLDLIPFVKRNLFQLLLLYLHHKFYEYGSKEVESVKGRNGRERSVKYMVVGKVRSQSGDCF